MNCSGPGRSLVALLGAGPFSFGSAQPGRLFALGPDRYRKGHHSRDPVVASEHGACVPLLIGELSAPLRLPFRLRLVDRVIGHLDFALGNTHEVKVEGAARPRFKCHLRISSDGHEPDEIDEAGIDFGFLLVEVDQGPVDLRAFTFDLGQAIDDGAPGIDFGFGDIEQFIIFCIPGIRERALRLDPPFLDQERQQIAAERGVTSLQLRAGLISHGARLACPSFAPSQVRKLLPDADRLVGWQIRVERRIIDREVVDPQRNDRIRQGYRGDGAFFLG